jgi:hypothetical protein
VLGCVGTEEPAETRVIASINATCEAAGVTLVEVPSRKNLDWPNAERRRDIEAAITAKQQHARTMQHRISVEPWSGSPPGCLVS